jgi:hypothetical protein
MPPYYSPLEDGSYLVEREDGLPPLRTAVDPVEYGYEQRPAEELAGYTPKPPTAEERLGAITARLEKSKRESDPEYAAEADAYDRQNVETQRLGESIKLARQAAPEQPTAQVNYAKAEQLGGFAPVDEKRMVSDAGTGNSHAAAGQGPRNRTRVTAPSTGPETVSRQGAPIPGGAGSGSAPDPERQALGDLVAGQVIKRSGPSKGGWSPTTVTTQREGTPTPEALAGVEAAARDVDAIGEQAINQRVSTLRERVIAPEIERLEAEVEDIEKKAERRKKYDSEIARLKTNAEGKERAAAEMPRINARDDYWADKGIFARILAAVAAGAFQFGQGLAGGSGPNIPIELTEAAIAENAELLRRQHDDATAAGVTARNAYTEALDTYGDPESAQTALRLETQAVADRMMDLRLRDVAGADQLAQWEVQKAERREQRAREYADISAKAAGTTVANERYTPASSGGSSIDPRMVELLLKIRGNGEQSPEGQGAQLRQREIEDKRRVWLPPALQQKLGLPTRTAFAADEAAAVPARSTMDIYTKGLAAIEEMERIYNTPAFELNPDLMARARANAGAIQSLVGQKALGLSQQTEGEFERITDALRGDQGMHAGNLDSEGKESLKKAKQLFLQDAEHHVRGLTKSTWELD